MIAKTMFMICVAVVLSGCATQMQLKEERQNTQEIASIKKDMNRNQLAILAVNKKVDALKSLVEGPGGLPAGTQ